MKRALRLAKHLLLTLAAASGGGVIRLWRRLLRKPPRVWHGMFPLVITKYIVAAERKAGYPARSVAAHTNPFSYALVRPEEFDLVVTGEGKAWFDVHWICLVDLLWRADVWVAYFDSLFFRADQQIANELALRLLRLCGIRIIAAAHGGDVVHQTPIRTRYDWVERMGRDYPNWNLVAQRTIALTRIRLFCKYADLVLPGDSSLVRFLPRNDVTFKYFPLDMNEIQPSYAQRRENPVLCHAPNHRFAKGTDLLLSAVDWLLARGFVFDLQVVERVDRVEALRRYAAADIVADQFCMGSFGTFGLEGMASGKPVLAYLDQEELGDPVFNLPFVNSNAENLARVLAVLIELPELRERLGRAGRHAVEMYQSIDALAPVWDRMLRHVWWREPLNLQSTRYFGADRQARAFTEDPAVEEFWPVEVADLMPRIREIIARVESA
jgi:glycosyltransferase involved in cell wall biosynthesis